MGSPKERPTMMGSRTVKTRHLLTDRSAPPPSSVFIYEWVILWVTPVGESVPRPCPDPYPAARLNGTWGERSARDPRTFGFEIERVIRHRGESMSAFKARVEKRAAELAERMQR